MKKRLFIICIVSMVFSLTACSGQTGAPGSRTSPKSAAPSLSGSEPATAEPEKDASDVLVVYFSATGTTRLLAGYISIVTGGDVYEIVPAEPYTAADLNYSNTNSRSSREQNNEHSRPAIAGGMKDIDEYDIIFLGYPIWWGDAPRIVYTFMESYDFSGKTIVPFCTSGGSGVGSSVNKLRDLAASDVTWLAGTRLDRGISHTEMVNWIRGLGLNVAAQ